MDGENNGKPYQNGWFWGKTHHLRKPLCALKNRHYLWSTAKIHIQPTSGKFTQLQISTRSSILLKLDHVKPPNFGANLKNIWKHPPRFFWLGLTYMWFSNKKSQAWPDPDVSSSCCKSTEKSKRSRIKPYLLGGFKQYIYITWLVYLPTKPGSLGGFSCR